MPMDCLLLIDLQNDFMPGGPLAVPGGDKVIPVANRLGSRFQHVLCSQDWHPWNHGSFASQHPGREPGEIVDLDGVRQILWPDHCVQDSVGADFHRDLDRRLVDTVFRKGVDRNLDSYSAFFDNDHRRSTGLGEHLRSIGVESVWLMGLATEYCVKFSALDAVGLGFHTTVIPDGCRGIDLNPGDVDRAWRELRDAGIKLLPEVEVP